MSAYVRVRSAEYWVKDMGCLVIRSAASHTPNRSVGCEGWCEVGCADEGKERVHKRGEIRAS